METDHVRRAGPSRPRLVAAIAVVTTAVALADAARMVATYRARGVELSWRDALQSALMDWWILGLLALPALALVRRFDLGPAHRARDAAVHVLVAPIFGAVHVLLFATASTWVRGDEWSAAIRSAALVKLPVSTLAYVCIVLGVAAWAAHRRAQRETARRERLAARLDAARLEALRARLRPHFLFNALNGIAGLVETNPRLAEELIGRLGNLLRRALATDDEAGELISLDDEIAALEDYLAIERARLGDRLSVEVDVPGDVGQTRLPPLLLQPIVENAVLHGAAARAEGGRVRVSARSTATRTLEIVVEDDGPGANGADRANGVDRANGGFGLAATRERLRLHFGDDAELRMESPARGGTRVEVTLPCNR